MLSLNWVWAQRRTRTQAQVRSSNTYSRHPCLALPPLLSPPLPFLSLNLYIDRCLGYKPKSWRKDCLKIRISCFSYQLLDVPDQVISQLCISASFSIAGGHDTDTPSQEHYWKDCVIFWFWGVFVISHAWRGTVVEYFVEEVGPVCTFPDSGWCCRCMIFSLKKMLRSVILRNESQYLTVSETRRETLKFSVIWSLPIPIAAVRKLDLAYIIIWHWSSEVLGHLE